MSAELISDVTAATRYRCALVPLFQAWQARPLAPCYVMVFLDALFVKVRVDGRVQTRALVTALGVTLDGLKDVLGLWSLAAESASAYAGVLTELQARGVEDIVVVATDGLTGAEEAVAAVYPQADHQRCLVHQMRSSLALVTHTDRKAVAASLKAVYNAATESEAGRLLAEAEAEWGERYGAVFASWHRHWPSLVAFLRYPVAFRRALYTTNAVEAVHRSFRRALKHRGPLPAQRDGGAEAVLCDGDAAVGDVDPRLEPLAAGDQSARRRTAWPPRTLPCPYTRFLTLPRRTRGRVGGAARRGVPRRPGRPGHDVAGGAAGGCYRVRVRTRASENVSPTARTTTPARSGSKGSSAAPPAPSTS